MKFAQGTLNIQTKIHFEEFNSQIGLNFSSIALSKVINTFIFSG